MSAPAPGARAQVLTVSVAGEWFGLPVSRVRTIFPLGGVTRVPLGPPALLGLVNLRGAILPAMSLRRRLEMPDAATMTDAPAVSLDQGEEAFALVVDDVGEVITVDEAEALPPPPHMAARRSAHTSVVYRLADALLPVLDVTSLAFGPPPAPAKTGACS